MDESAREALRWRSWASTEKKFGEGYFGRGSRERASWTLNNPWMSARWGKSSKPLNLWEKLIRAFYQTLGDALSNKGIPKRNSVVWSNTADFCHAINIPLIDCLVSFRGIACKCKCGMSLNGSIQLKYLVNSCLYHRRPTTSDYWRKSWDHQKADSRDHR